MNESYDESLSITEQNLRKAARKKTVIGVIMLLSLIVLPILVFYIQFLVPPSIIILLFIGFGATAMIGLAMIFWYGKGASLFFHSLDLLKKLAPPDPIIIGRCAVLNKNSIYGVGTWGSNVIMFVAFYSKERVFNQKLSIPRTIWKWEYKHQINDIKVARREGSYTIPLGNNEYYTGEGVLYALLLESGAHPVYIQRSFTSEQLHQIVDHLSNEVASYGSSHRIDDDL